LAAGGIADEARLAVAVVVVLRSLGLAEDRPGATIPTNAVNAAVSAPAPAAVAQRARVTRASMASRRS
jgi:hypothetical protein